MVSYHTIAAKVVIGPSNSHAVMSSCQIFYHSTIPSPVVIYVHGTNNYACRYGCWVCVCGGGGGGGGGGAV